jgi:hypothetical protein
MWRASRIPYKESTRKGCGRNMEKGRRGRGKKRVVGVHR